MLFSTAYAQTAPAAGGSDLQVGLMQILPLILIMGVFYVLLIRPQQQKMKAVKAQQDALRRGDKIVTAGGVIGLVTKIVSESEIEVKIAENVHVRVIRNTVTVMGKTEPAPKDETGKVGTK